MRTFWRWMLRALLLLIAVALVGGFIFRRKIEELHAVYTYANAFKPNVIDENFRSLYKLYPAVRVEHGSEVSELPKAEERCRKPMPPQARPESSPTGSKGHRPPASL